MGQIPTFKRTVGTEMIGILRPSGAPPTRGRFFLAASAGLCEGVFGFHSHSFPFFTREVTGNSTGKGGYSHE